MLRTGKCFILKTATYSKVNFCSSSATSSTVDSCLSAFATPSWLC